MSERITEEQARAQKVVDMKALGVPAYAAGFHKVHRIGGLQALADLGGLRDSDTILTGPANTIQTAGRVTLMRAHGKLSFAKLRDESGEVQLMFHKDVCSLVIAQDADSIKDSDPRFSVLKTPDGEEISAYKFLEKFVDMGDFLGVRGELFLTHKGELTIFVSEFVMLAKTILPMGDKRHGIEDPDLKYRKRYLDMIFNRETLERMKFRSKFMKVIRDFYDQEGFMEVETSILGNAASGAAAKPFVTRHEDFDMNVFLRIAAEPQLKMATAGGLEKIFEVCRDFRNEGSDPSHMQEFTQIEHYAVYRDYRKNMDFTERMFEYVIDKLGLSKTISVKDKGGNLKEVNFTTPRARVDYIEQIKKDSGIDVSQYSPDDADRLRNDIQKNGHTRVGIEHQGTATMIDYLYKKVTRPKIVGPAFIFNYPKTMQPLARVSDSNPGIVEQRQLLINGREVIKAYSELVDPLQQEANFAEQGKALARGDEEAVGGDEEFMLAMKHGMPPQSGRGMGIDRIVALLTQQDNLRDTILFPLMKPLSPRKEETGKSKETGGENIQNATYTIQHDVVDYGQLPSREQVDNLAGEYLTETLRHCQDVAKCMAYFARKLGQDEHSWYTAGLLHDIDWDHIAKAGDKHLKDEFEAIIAKIGLGGQIVQDIKAHGPRLTGVEPSTLLAKYLISVDELSGFVFAVARLRPSGLSDLEVSSVKKKLKDKKFAAGIDREHVMNCEKYLGIGFDEFCGEVIEGMR